MRTLHQPLPSTVAALNEAKRGQTWRSLAHQLGYEDATAGASILCGVAKSKASSISEQGERDLRVALGLPPGARKRKAYWRLCVPVEWEQTITAGEARKALGNFVMMKKASPESSIAAVVFGLFVARSAEQYKETNSLPVPADSGDYTGESP